MEIETNPMTELRNNYWMIQKLGVGGFGKVYLIKQVYSKKTVFLTFPGLPQASSSYVPNRPRNTLIMVRDNMNKIENFMTNTTAASK